MACPFGFWELFPSCAYPASKRGVEFERLSASPVKTYMIRAGLILAVLMSLLLPVAPIQRENQSSSVPAGDHVLATSGCHLTDVSDICASPVHEIFHLIKPWNRRFSLPIVLNGLICSVAVDAQNELRPENPFDASSRFGFFAAMARSWQFQRRAALSPRAPSLVS